MGHEADVHAIRAAAHELTGARGDFDALVDRVGDAGCVLIGESTHGTAQFYAARAHITKRLIEEKGFAAVAIEGDGPGAQRAGAWARGAGEDPDAATALGAFTRFGRWTWRNVEVVAFLEWLREHNRATGQDVGLHGLDLTSRHAPVAEARDGDAELHDRAMSQIGPEGWNRRDGHMAQTLDVLRTQLAADGRPGKVVVWAHNSHVGDARATEQAVLSQHTLGQLAREAYGADAVLVGQTTYTGTVTAASDWGGPAGTMPVAPARDDALEALLHASGPANLLLVMADDAGAAAALAPSRLQRAIGVVYQPHTEWLSHYVFADVTRQFDALIHLDTTSALEPLDQAASASAMTVLPNS